MKKKAQKTEERDATIPWKQEENQEKCSSQGKKSFSEKEYEFK